MAEQRTRPGWQSFLVEAFTGGINSATRPELLEQTELLRADNVVLKQSRTVMDTGYKTFGNTVRGTPQTDYQYINRAGLSLLLLITTDTVYKYSEASATWEYVSNGNSTTSTVQANAGALTITLTSAANFANGDYFGIVLDNGVQHETQVNGTPVGNVVTFYDAIPVGRYAPAGTTVLEAVLLGGDADHQISIVAVPSNDWVVFTNGVDLPMKFDGVDCKVLPNLPVGFNSCRVVALYNASLFMMNCTEGGLDLPQRIRRTDIGDPTNWTTNLAGFDDLYDSVNFILAAEIMGPYLIVYRDRSIMRGQYINTAGKVYDWITVVDGEGAASSGSIVNMNSTHLLFGNAGIYAYTGGYELDSIGDNVFYTIFSEQGDLASAYQHRVFSFYVEELDEAWFFYPSGVNEFPDTLLRYNVGNEAWTRRKFAHQFIGFGFYQTITAQRWVDLVGPWTAQVWTWNSRTVSSESPTTHLMSATTSQVMEYDYIATTDSGTAVTSVVETMDFFSTAWSMRFDTVQMYLKGQSVLVEYSIDSGDIYTTLGTVTSSELEIHTLSAQVICDKIRFRLTCSQPGFELSWLGFSYREEAGPMFRRV